MEVFKDKVLKRGRLVLDLKVEWRKVERSVRSMESAEGRVWCSQ